MLWGRQDQILEPRYAQQFESALPNGRLEWVEECGHCAHLEQPDAAAAAILSFLLKGVEPSTGAGTAAGAAAAVPAVPTAAASTGVDLHN